MIRWVLKHPIPVISLYIIILILGFLSFKSIKIELIPEISYPSISVIVTSENISADMMERNVTRVIEGISGTLEKVKRVYSNTSQGLTNITFEFYPDVDFYYIKQRIIEELRTLKFGINIKSIDIRENPPEEMKKEPSFQFVIYGPFSEVYLTEVSKKLKKLLQKLEGVREVEIQGKSQEKIELFIKDPLIDKDYIQRLFLYNRDEYVGKTKSGEFDIPVRIKKLSLDKIRIKGKNVNKIAILSVKQDENRIITHLNGKPYIMIKVKRDENINPLLFSKRLRKFLNSLKFFKGVSYKIFYDEAEELNKIINSVFLISIISVSIVLILLFIFFRNIFVGFTFILSVLFCIFITVFFLHIFGFSLNVFTLTGIALGFGMIVDANIVVLENIMRLKEKGEKDSEEKGAKEVFLPVFASILTTIAVYLPFIYFRENIKNFYIPFAFSSSVSLLASLFVAFTFVPLFSGLIKAKKKKDIFFYRKILYYLLRFPFSGILLYFILLFSGYYVFNKLLIGGNFRLFKPSKEIFLSFRFPLQVELEEAEKIAKFFEKIIENVEGEKEYLTTISSRNIILRIKSKNEDVLRKIANKIANSAFNFAGARIYLTAMGKLIPVRTSGIMTFPHFTLEGWNRDRMLRIAKGIEKKLYEDPRVRDVDLNFVWLTPQKEYILSPKKDFWMREEDISFAGLLSRLSTFSLFFYETENKKAPFLIYNSGNLSKEKYLNKKILNRRIKDLFYIYPEKEPVYIERENGIYRQVIAFDYIGPAQSLFYLKRSILNSVKLPPGFTLKEYTFEQKEESVKLKTILITLLIALFLLYAIISSLYESYTKSILILSVIPVSISGAFFIYYIFLIPFDINSIMGVLLLFGICVNTSIILVDQYVKYNVKTKEEVIELSQRRLRPILITALTTAGGFVPFLFLKTEKILFSNISLSLIGGMITSTLTTLFIIPCLYYLVLLFNRSKN